MDWDDLRYFVELVRAGTLSGAAQHVGVTHTTISRRLQRLEHLIGEPLFTRSQQGYALTPRGHSLWIEAQQIEAAFGRIGQQLPRARDTLSGFVRIGCTEGFGTHVIAPLIGQLHDRYPGLQIDLIVQPRPILLTKNEADLVITIDRPERGPYTLAKLTDYSLHLYTSRSYLDRAGPIFTREDLSSHPLISYIVEHSPARNLPTLSQLNVALTAVMRSTSIVAQKAMIASGAGIAILPDFIVKEGDDLICILEELSFHRSFWMVVPTTLRRAARIRVVSDAIRALVHEQKPLLIRR